MIKMFKILQRSPYKFNLYTYKKVYSMTERTYPCYQDALTAVNWMLYNTNISEFGIVEIVDELTVLADIPQDKIKIITKHARSH
jgi:hypothetical protein